MKKDRQRKVQEQLVGIIFILILFLFLIINIIVPNKEKYSAGEPYACNEAKVSSEQSDKRRL